MGKRGNSDFSEEASRVEREEEDVLRPVLDEIAKQKEAAEKEGRSFTSPTTDQLRKKLSSRNSPFVNWQSWNSAAPGGTINYQVGIYNPDPTTAIWLFGHLFVGPGNVVSDVGLALASIDPRFPSLTQPQFAGLSIPANSQSSLSFALPIPTGVPSTNYLGNTFVFQEGWHDVGTYYDRGGFVFQVT